MTLSGKGDGEQKEGKNTRVCYHRNVTSVPWRWWAQLRAQENVFLSRIVRTIRMTTTTTTMTMTKTMGAGAEREMLGLDSPGGSERRAASGFLAALFGGWEGPREAGRKSPSRSTRQFPRTVEVGSFRTRARSERDLARSRVSRSCFQLPNSRVVSILVATIVLYILNVSVTRG